MRRFISLLLIICLILGVCLLSGCDKDNNGESIGGAGGGVGDGIGGGADGGAGENGDSEWKEINVALENGKYKIARYYKERITEEYYYDAQGNREYYVDYEYNDAGQLIRLSWSSNDIGIYAAGFYEYDYDENGKLVQKRVLNGIQNPEEIYDYNADGTTDVTTYPRGKFPVFTNYYATRASRIVTHLDANGKKVYADGYSDQYGHVTHTEYNDDGSGVTHTYDIWDESDNRVVVYITTFDAKEQLLQEKYYHSTRGHIITITDGVFDDNGVLVGKIERGLDNFDNIESYSDEIMRNLNNVILWYKCYENGVLQYGEKNELNEQGRIARTEKTDGNGKLTEYTLYEYYENANTENGNLRKEMHYDSDGVFLYGNSYDENGVSEYISPDQ